MKKKDEICEENICSCLFETLIEESDECVFTTEDEPFTTVYDINQVADMYEYMRRHTHEDDDEYEGAYEDYDIDFNISDYYETLCLLSKDSMNIDDRPYFRVMRMINLGRVIDCSKWEKAHDITVWSNGKIDLDEQSYLIYWKGTLIGEEKCPPSEWTIYRNFRDYICCNGRINYGIGVPEDLKRMYSEWRFVVSFNKALIKAVGLIKKTIKRLNI